MKWCCSNTPQTRCMESVFWNNFETSFSMSCKAISISTDVRSCDNWFKQRCSLKKKQFEWHSKFISHVRLSCWGNNKIMSISVETKHQFAIAVKKIYAIQQILMKIERFKLLFVFLQSFYILWRNTSILCSHLTQMRFQAGIAHLRLFNILGIENKKASFALSIFEKASPE